MIGSYSGQTLTLSAEEEEEVRALSIAPGGNIIQHIERDTNDPRIWDMANSKIVNVQLIDSRTFRLVTGMPPPKTPITPDTYERMGLPFYRLWREDGEAEGIVSAWASVKSAMAVASGNLMSSLNMESKMGQGGSALAKIGDWWPTPSAPYPKSSQGGDGDHSSGTGDFVESSFDFPIVLLDVDDTLPKFVSVVEEEDRTEWNEEGLYDR